MDAHAELADTKQHYKAAVSKAKNRKNTQTLLDQTLEAFEAKLDADPGKLELLQKWRVVDGWHKKFIDALSYRAVKQWGKKKTTNPDSRPLLLGDGGATQRSGNNYLQRHGTNGVDMNVAALLGGGGDGSHGAAHGVG